MYTHAARSGDLADMHRAMRAKDVQRRKEKALQAKSDGVSVSHPEDVSEKQAEHIGRKVAAGEEAKAGVRQQKGSVQRIVQRQPNTKGKLTLKTKPVWPYYLPEDETYQHRYDYKDAFNVPYKDASYGKIYTDKDRAQVEDAYVIDLAHDNIPAQPSGGKAFVYRRDITVDLKDGRSVHIVMDMVNIRMDDKVSMDSKGLTRFKYLIVVSGGQTKVLPREGQGELGGVSINELITKMSTTGNTPLELLQNSPLNQHYLLTAKQFADGLTLPAGQTQTQSGPITWDKMSPSQKRVTALRDIIEKVSFKNIIVNAIIAIIGVVALAIIAVLFGWEVAVIAALIVLVVGFLLEYSRAKDDEEKLNIIVRYIAYVVLAVAAIILAPEILAATGSILATGMIIGAVAALTLLAIGMVFLWRRVKRASEVKNPDDYNKETDQGARVIETTLVDVFVSIVSGFIPSMEKTLPPGMKNKWNPFLRKTPPGTPPVVQDPLHPRGQKGKGLTTTRIKNPPGFTVDYNGKPVPVYRGGSNFTIKSTDIRINPSNSLVKTSHGLSVNVDPVKVGKFGGAYEIKSIPVGLKIIQRGKSPEHFEIVPSYEMSEVRFQSLLDQIKTELKK